MDWTRLLSTKRVKGLYGIVPSTKDVDVRSEFERDYGRSVFSTPVRRLQDKAQVFPLEEHDAVRTRLTHSMEVSSVARGLAKRVADQLCDDKELDHQQASDFATIAATCGLIHDLGNPPFGHAGEESIALWFSRKSPHIFDEFAASSNVEAVEQSQFAQDFLKFEGNAQTQRLLSRLQVLADDFGLNLTCATLSASCKYTAASNETTPENQAHKKHGYFASENDLMNLLRNETGTGKQRHPIATLVEASDDIVYALVDIEDGIKKRCLSWSEAKQYLEAKCACDCLKSALQRTEDKLRHASLPATDRDEAYASAFRTAAVALMVDAVANTFLANYDEIMSANYPFEILYKSPASVLAKGCKDLARKHVYSNPQVIKRELKGRAVLCDLMDLYWQAASAFELNTPMKGYPAKVYSLISPNYRHVFERNLREAYKFGVPAAYYRMQLVTDQISGMTDSYAVNLHKELTNG